MGLFKKRSSEEIDQLKAEMASMSARLDEADRAKHELGAQVHGITTRLDTPIAPPPTEPPPAPPAPPPTVDPAELDVLRAKLQRVNDRIDQLDTRITQISTELANQLTELGDDIEALGSNEPPTDQVVEELRDAQTRLAGEQARYQIAFRQDMADLAERLRRT